MISLKHTEDTVPLPTSTYILLDNEKEVGVLQIRHVPSIAPSLPQDMASHIYYEINEEERGKGYGNQILHLAKEEARKLGLQEIRLTVWDANIPSKKIIEANGGELLQERYIDDKKDTFLLYRIVL